jgi:hypothetical protein
MAQDETQTNDERIVAAAIKAWDGSIFTAPRHHTCLRHMAQAKVTHVNRIEGFMTSRDRFLPRGEALGFALRIGQVKSMNKLIDKKRLTSEDLW